MADDGSLKICKLHGGVGAHGERITADMVATTMDGISRRNVPWLDYIAGLLESRDLCLAGYSGRDIDYYPELKERKLASAGGRDWLWFVGPRPGGGLAGPQARAAGAVLLAMRPKQAVEEMRGRLLGGWGRAGAAASTAIGEALAPGYAEGSMNAKDEFLNLVLDKHLRGVELDAGLFWLVLYLRMGLLGKAEGALRACEGQASSSGRNWSVREQALLLSAELTLRREFADFEGYRAAARRLLALAGDARKGDPSFEGAWANARLQVVSSYQMEIPAHLCFPVPLVQRRYPLLALISVRYPLLIRDLARLRERHDRKHPSDRRGFVEHNPYVGVENEARVRWLAVKTGYALRLGGVLRARVVRELRELYEDAVLSGNYGTALGVAVYLDRLGDSGEWLDKVEWSTGILKEKSFLSRSLRDRGDYDGALAQAEASGNVLNAVKALMGKAHARYENLGSIWGNVSLLEADDLEKLDRYTERVTPAKLRNTIKGLRDGYICPMRA